MAIEDMFPVQDITFRSKRKQGDWDINEVTTTEGYFIEQPPVSTTLESVIQYLRNRKTADSEAKVMKAVIDYLEEYRMLKVEMRHSNSSNEESAENEVSNETGEDDSPTVTESNNEGEN